MNAPAVPEGVRLFLALDLPGGAREAIGRWRDSAVRGRAELRPVPDEALHVTVVFLGRRPRAMVDRVWQTAASSLAGRTAPTFTPAGSKTVPPRRPRVLAIDLEDRGGEAAAVHQAVSVALAEAGLHDPGPRALWPHVTVARVRTRARLHDLEVSPPPAAAFTARTVTLYRSDLHPAGARYVALERLELA